MTSWRFARAFLGAMIVQLVCACAATVPAPIVESGRPASSQSQSIEPSGEIARAPASADETIRSAPTAGSNAATAALLAGVDAELSANATERANAMVERALAIDPNDPWVWLRLARVRYVERNFSQAIAAARRANSLGQATAASKYAGWRLIADSERAAGNRDAAASAEREAAAFAP